MNKNKKLMESMEIFSEDKPKEPARPCPNCGELKWESQLGYSSSISTPFGGSTLYGVCKECAKIHNQMDENYGWL